MLVQQEEGCHDAPVSVIQIMRVSSKVRLV